MASTLTSSRAPTKSEKLRALMKRYGIQFDGPVESTPHNDCPRNLRSTFDHIKRLGKTEFEQYREIIAPDLRNFPWKEQVPRRACRVASLANACRTARKNEASWRLAVESEVMARFSVEVSCRTCRGRLWRSEQEVVPNCENEQDRDNTLRKRQQSRKPCACRSDVAKDDIQEHGINPLFDDRADEAIVYYPEVQAILGKRKLSPDRIYGLRKTKRFERILYREDKRKSSSKGKYIGDNTRTTPFCPDGEPVLFPFLVIEAKSEKGGAPFSSIEAQTAFAIRELLLVQDELRQAAEDDMDWDAAPLAWFLSYRGEQWRVSAAFIKWVNKQRIYRVVRLWHGEIDTKDGALQLLLIIDYICDWARDKYREAIIQALRSLAVNDTRSLAQDSDVFSTFDPSTRWSPWVPTQGNFTGPVFGNVESDPFKDLDNETGAVRDVRYIRSHMLGIYLTEDNFDYLMESTDSEEDSQELAREILQFLKSAWRVERTALDLLELIWTGKDCCGSDTDPPEKGFLVVAGIGAYLSPEWEPSRIIFYFAVAESLISSLAQVAELDPMEALDVLRAPRVDDEKFAGCFSRFRRHPARDNLLACLSRSYVNSDTLSPHSTGKKDPAPSIPRSNSSSELPSVGQVVHQIYKRHCIGRCKPSSSLFRISDRLDLVPLVDCPFGEELEVLPSALWPLARGVPDTKNENVLFAMSQSGSKKGPQQCVFIMDPSEGSVEKQLERIQRSVLSWQFSVKKFDIQRKWAADWNITDVLAPAKCQSQFIRILKSSFSKIPEDTCVSQEEDTKNSILRSESVVLISTETQQPIQSETDPILLKRLETDGFVELSFSSSQSLEVNKTADRSTSEASFTRSELHVDLSYTETSQVNIKESPSKRTTRSKNRQSQACASVNSRLSGVHLEAIDTKAEHSEDEAEDEDIERTPRKRKMGRRHSALASASADASVEVISSSPPSTKRKRAKTTTEGSFSQDFLDDAELTRLISQGYFSK
ncbi:hypothetical protein jhhlp_004767 [Lomentospora prolificans]|uniref:Uncharacterized protein n=1 Tax=Lomentospora prolificans TaxID=41688 RepID=A0A2N3N8I2_9PEZI|nr:hypothetical protein jhhlp_004767 [Lomentospora prolificans]